ncbi:MAG: ATP-binding protein [Candidatus Firestonebacteria bacterium]
MGFEGKNEAENYFTNFQEQPGSELQKTLLDELKKVRYARTEEKKVLSETISNLKKQLAEKQVELKQREAAMKEKYELSHQQLRNEKQQLMKELNSLRSYNEELKLAKKIVQENAKVEMETVIKNILIQEYEKIPKGINENFSEKEEIEKITILYKESLSMLKKEQETLLSEKISQLKQIEEMVESLKQEKNILHVGYEEKLQEVDRLNLEVQDLKKEMNTVKEKRQEMMKDNNNVLLKKDEHSLLEELVFGISHQIRNPLGVISANAQFLLSKKQGEKEKEILEGVLRSAQNIEERIEVFFELVKPPIQSLKTVSLNNVLDVVVSLVEQKCKVQNVKLIKDYPADLPMMSLDVNRLKLVFLNVMLNSLSAMPEGGNINVNACLDSEKKGIVIKIIDDGCGVSKKNISQVFMPFFTTKEGSLGLGLFFAKIVVQAHGGQINIVNNTGSKGATVMIFLPLAM